MMNRGQYAAACAAIAKLCELYPKTFFMWEPRRRPLKIGIHAELVAAGIEPSLINAALRLYCACYGYRRAMLTGSVRLGLDGEPAGVVTLEEAASAEELQKRKAKWLAHKEVMRRRAEEKERLRQEAEATAARPKRLSLNDLKAAAAARRQTEPVA
jgi:ProP effector